MEELAFVVADRSKYLVLDGSGRLDPSAKKSRAGRRQGDEPLPPVGGITIADEHTGVLEAIKRRDQVARVHAELGRELALAQPTSTFHDDQETQIARFEPQGGQRGDEPLIDPLADAHEQEADRRRRVLHERRP